MGEPADGLALLDEAGQPAPGTVEVDGSVLRFVPLDDLALLGSYTAVVTPAVTDLAGNPLAVWRQFEVGARDRRLERAAGIARRVRHDSAIPPGVSVHAGSNIPRPRSRLTSPLERVHVRVSRLWTCGRVPSGLQRDTKEVT